MSGLKTFERIAIIGASGTVGRHFTEELLKTGMHKITALVRESSTSTPPAGVAVAHVDYNNHESLVNALRGQDFLIITLGAYAAPDAHERIVKAAASAGVEFVMPNVYGSDYVNEKLGSEDFYGAGAAERCRQVERAGLKCIAMVCGFWYDTSLVGSADRFGFDIPTKHVNFFDDGATPITMTTLRQCGRAVAKLLSLPVEGGPVSVSDWATKPFYVASFTISQREMLDSVNRILGLTDQDWTITSEPSVPRYEKARAAMHGKTSAAQMDRDEILAFIKSMYTRIFFPSGGADYESTRGLANGLIDLAKEDVDAVTNYSLTLSRDPLGSHA